MAGKTDLQAVNNFTPALCFDQGTNIRQAMASHPEETKKLIFKGLVDLVKFVDASRTINGEDHFRFTLEALVNDFPALTVEEFLLVFSNMKKGVYGKYYERLKLAEIEECIRKYEGEQRAEFLEKKNGWQQYEKSEDEKFDRDKFYAAGMAYQEELKKLDDDRDKKEAEYRKLRNELYKKSQLKDTNHE